MQRTFIRHATEGTFQSVAPGIFVRDLGIGDINGGEYAAQVIRLEPEGARVEHLHRHDEGFSLAYVLHGWLDVEFEQIGVHHLEPGAVIPAFNHRRVCLVAAWFICLSSRALPEDPECRTTSPVSFYKRRIPTTRTSAVFDAMWNIKPRIWPPGVVANPRDAYGHRCGLRLARRPNTRFY